MNSSLLRFLLLGALLGGTVVACGDSDEPTPTPGPDAGGDVDPGTDTDVVDPGTDTDVIDPGTDTDVVDPGTDTDVVDPGTDTDVVDPPGPGNIVEVATEAGVFTTLLAAATAADLVDTLTGPGPFTVFAPTDDAFAALLAELEITAEELLANDDLATILLYHVISGAAVASGDVTTGPATMASGTSSWLNAADGVVINNATVSGPDVQASNGVIHIIDAVILPADIADLAGYAGLTTLAAAVEAADLGGLVSDPDADITVLAPTNAAFAAAIAALETTAEDLLADPALGTILAYHAIDALVESSDLEDAFVDTLADLSAWVEVEDDAVSFNGSNVVIADIIATNGIIHVIDAVLLPPTVAELVAFSSDLSTLNAALAAFDLDDALDSAEGEFTLFAPSNDAFADLLAELEVADLTELVAELGEDGTETVLLYHVLGAAVESGDVVDGFANTLSGFAIALDADGGVSVNQADVVAADIRGTNGVIHAIDAVITPSTIGELVAWSGATSTLAAVATRADADASNPGIIAALSNAESELTLFAPDNAAFAAFLRALSIVPSTVESLFTTLQPPSLIITVLTSHVTTGVATSDVVVGLEEATMLSGVTLPVDADDLTLGGARLNADGLDFLGTNGVIHLLRDVIDPRPFIATP